MSIEPFTLPENLLLGVATSALQIEGGDTQNDWYRWSRQPGRIADGTDSFRAADHYARYKEDAELMAEMHVQVYRMGVEWSRIEPQNGVFDREAVKHYRDEITLLREKGIRVLVTLLHFSLPLWVADAGGFLCGDISDWFVRYVEYITEQLADLVSEWVTVNEPNVQTFFGYVAGVWPPGNRKVGDMIKACRHMVRCHTRAYTRIHEIRASRGFADTKVGCAMHMRVFDTSRGGRLTGRLMQYLFQDALLASMADGAMRIPFGVGGKKGKYSDFIGLNYYTRCYVRLKGFEICTLQGVAVNDLGWEIYPEGLTILCKALYAKFSLPVWITENGTCDNNDAFRARYLAEHVRRAADLLKEGVPVERYYHWTLTDNFEWAEGESARFGLVHVDFQTQQRTVKHSGRFFTQLAAQRGVTQEMAEAFLQTQTYVMK